MGVLIMPFLRVSCTLFTSQIEMCEAGQFVVTIAISRSEASHSYARVSRLFSTMPCLLFRIKKRLKHDTWLHNVS